jgi:hypothetical protein
MSLRVWSLAIALAVLPAQESAAAKPPRESPQLPEASPYVRHMCRLEFDQAARIAADEDERLLAEMWAEAVYGDGVIDLERLDRLETPQAEGWKSGLWARQVVFGRAAEVFPELGDVKESVVGLEPQGTSTLFTAERALLVTVGGKRLFSRLSPESQVSTMKPRAVRAVDLPRVAVLAEDAAELTRSEDLALLEIGVGQASVRGTPVVLTRGGELTATGYLGWSFLRQFRWVVNHGGGRVQLLPSQESRRNLVYVDHPIVHVTIDGEPALARIALTTFETELTAYGAARLAKPLGRRSTQDRSLYGHTSASRLQEPITLTHEGASIQVKQAENLMESPQDGVCVDVVIGHDMITHHRTMVLDGPAGFVKFGGEP